MNVLGVEVHGDWKQCTKYGTMPPLFRGLDLEVEGGRKIHLWRHDSGAWLLGDSDYDYDYESPLANEALRKEFGIVLYWGNVVREDALFLLQLSGAEVVEQLRVAYGSKVSKGAVGDE